MVKTVKIDVCDDLRESFKELRSYEPASFKQKLIRFKYLLKLKQVEEARKNPKNIQQFGIMIIQQMLNSTIAQSIFDRYANAIDEENLTEFDKSFELMNMEYLRLKKEMELLKTSSEVITKAEAKSILRKYIDEEITEEDLLPYANTKKITGKILAFPRR
jgi:hypothetical protein